MSCFRDRRSRTVSISSCVVPRPRLKRIAPWPTSGAICMACNTGDSSTRPAWHAEPAEAATPSSRARISVADLSDERDVEGVRQAQLGMPVENHAVAESGPQSLPEAVAEPAYALHGLKVAGKFACRAQADRQQRALGSRSSATLMATAVDQRLQRRAAPDIERTHALWRVELVAGDRQKIDAERVHVRRDLADGLRGVGVQQDAALGV